MTEPAEPCAATRRFLDGDHRLLIGGEWVVGQGSTIAVENPARETALAEVRAASLGQVDQAVAAARAALKAIGAEPAGVTGAWCSTALPTCSMPIST